MTAQERFRFYRERARSEPDPKTMFNLAFELGGEIENLDEMAQVLRDVAAQLEKWETTDGIIYNEKNEEIGNYGVD